MTCWFTRSKLPGPPLQSIKRRCVTRSESPTARWPSTWGSTSRSSRATDRTAASRNGPHHGDGRRWRRGTLDPALVVGNLLDVANAQAAAVLQGSNEAAGFVE